MPAWARILGLFEGGFVVSLERVMDEVLRKAELFHGMSGREIEMLTSLARYQSLEQGEYLFRLGDAADRLFVVATGSIELCLPMALGKNMKDLPVESVSQGGTLGWSALVKPHRFTLSARGGANSEVVSFLRHDLLRLFDAEPRTGYALQTRLSELVGLRLLRVQALWTRELQRALTGEGGRASE